MEPTLLYGFAADALLFIPLLFVVFIIAGLLLTFAGKLFAWPWVRNPWFRFLHLIGIGVVVIQSWLGVLCPLTHWESALRAIAGEDGYDGSFISHWMATLLYYHAPEWVFIVAYTLFGSLVALAWLWVRPRPFNP